MNFVMMWPHDQRERFGALINNCNKVKNVTRGYESGFQAACVPRSATDRAACLAVRGSLQASLL